MKKSRKTKLLTLAAALAVASWSAQAITVDLTTAGSSGSINGGLYTQVSQQHAGSGSLDSFVRVGAANQDVVQAYNTTTTPVFDNEGGATFNHEITVGQVGLIGSVGSQVMRFILDINQIRSSSLLNLDEVQIFLSKTPNQSTTAFSGGLLNLADAALVYQMDALGDNKVTLDYSLNPGSGVSDMTLDILASALDPAFATLGLTSAAQMNGAYIYLYSKFGSAPNVNNDGYEEWAYTQGDPMANPPGGPGEPMPEPATPALLAIGLLGWLATRRSRARI